MSIKVHLKRKPAIEMKFVFARDAMTRHRNELQRYEFTKPLSGRDAIELAIVIGWRRGSKVIEQDGVVGCVADPKDMANFLKNKQKRIRLMEDEHSDINERKNRSGTDTPL